MENLSTLLAIGLPALGIVLALLIVGLTLTRLYKRASKDTAFVRTGFGGAKVIKDGGALVFPILHDVVPVSLGTQKLTVKRIGAEALITNDNLRADCTVEFFLRVAPNAEAIEAAAQTLGDKSNDQAKLKELVEGKFVDALRAVAASMTLENLHLQRAEFVQSVQNVVKTDLEKNGLELEAASLTGLDQTAQEHFNPDNSFDAKGLAKLRHTIETKRLERFQIEQSVAIQIAEGERDATKRKLEIARETETATMDQQRTLALARAKQEADIASEQANRRKESEEARLKTDRDLEEIAIVNAQTIALAGQQRDIAVAKASGEKLEAEREASVAKAEAVRAAENVLTAEAVARAERDKSIKLIAAQQKAEESSITLTVAAEAEKTAAGARADALRIQAQAESDGDNIRAEGKKAIYAVDAEGQRALNEARNVIDAEILKAEIRTALIAKLPEIIAASVKPLENIDGIRLLQVSGMENLTGGAGAGAATGGAGLPDQLVNALLKHKACGPLVDQLMGEVGITSLTAQGLADAVSASDAPAPAVVQTPVVETADAHLAS